MITVDYRPVTDYELCEKLGIIPPESPAETVAWYMERGHYADAKETQEYQIKAGRKAALDGETYCAAWPTAMRRGYVEALQDLEH